MSKQAADEGLQQGAACVLKVTMRDVSVHIHCTHSFSSATSISSNQGREQHRGATFQDVNSTGVPRIQMTQCWKCLVSCLSHTRHIGVTYAQ
jgi:hypothetical protein